MWSNKSRLASAAVTATLTLGLAAPAFGATGGPVSTTPAAWTPHLPAVTSSVMQVRQLAQCGGTMYAVGSFTTIRRYSSTFSRNNAFSFSATTGAVTSWNPNVNGTVNSIALSADCSTAYLGGVFTLVNGTAVKNVVSVSASTGAVNTAFAHNAGGQVEALLISGNHLLTGGYFTGINGSTKKYMVSLNPTSGLDDGYVNLNISGHYVYTDDGGRSASSNASRVYNFELSPDRTRLLVMGDFTSVAGQRRQQIFMLDLGLSAATLDPWYSTEFNANCATVEPFYVQAAAWSPDGSSVYVATTGYKPANGTGYRTSDPRAGLCDAAARFPSSKNSALTHSWVNYTGCDSYFSVAADVNDVYVGGHERWANNPRGCDNAGPGAVSRPGLGGLSPSTGAATSWNPTRARGLGADDMIVTTSPAGLWIASDNAYGSDMCGHVYGKAGICFLPA
jgi:hypothetical protein